MTGMLDGRVAIVTGGAQGIGYGTTKQLVQAGATVVIVDVDADQAQRRVEEFGADSVKVFIADLYDRDAPGQIMAFAREECGGLDILVNNAGIHWDSLVHRMTDAQWQSVLDIHVTIPFRLLRAAEPHFIDLARQDRAAGVEGRFRKAVTVSSGAAYGNVGAANYAAGKAGALGLTRALAAEWKPHNVTVNAVAMGLVATRFGIPQSNQNRVQVGGYDVQLGVPRRTYERRGVTLGEETGEEVPDEEIYAVKRGPGGAPRGGTINDAGKAIFYLCSPLSDFISGEVHHVGGGGFGYGIW
jgi:3-oxoacyl-[acyl-carrier protein] reductase